MVVHIDPSRHNRPCPRCGANVHGANADTCPACGWSMTPTCIGCGYDLAGLPREAACPECGTAVERSYAPDLLENRSGAYLRQLLLGLDLVVIGTLCSVGLMVLAIPTLLVMIALEAGEGAQAAVEFILGALALVFSGAVFLGWWKLTTPDPARVSTELDTAPRRVVRVTVAIQVGATLLGVAVAGVSLSGSAGSAGLEHFSTATELISTVAWAVQFFAAMLYVRWLARRIPDRDLESHAKRLMWLGPLLFVLGMPCVGIGPLVALILYLIVMNWLRRHVRLMVGRLGTA